MPDTPLSPTGFRRQFSYTETPAQRRRHIDHYSLTVWQGGFRGPVLFGTLSDLIRYKGPADRGKCQSGTERFSAVG